MVEENPTTEQDKNLIKNPNPKGLGGFGDHPDHINKGGRPKNDQRVGYWLQFFKDLTLREFENYAESEEALMDWPVAQVLAYERIKLARQDLDNYREVVDRTEGKAKLTIEHEGGLFSTDKLTLEIVDPEANNADKS